MEALDIDSILHNLGLLMIAYVLALPTAWNRERNDRSAGLRTFPLVAVATCGYMLIAMDVLTDMSSQGRVFVGIITGMGFIGGGAILKDAGRVSGTATAASLWSTGAIGLAVAWGRFEIALLLSALNYLTLRLFPVIKEAAGEKVVDEGNDDQ